MQENSATNRVPEGRDFEHSRSRNGACFVEEILRLGFGAKFSLAWVMAMRDREWRMWQGEVDEPHRQGRM